MAQMSFEEALQKLEKIVDALENKDLTIEEALKKYETGIKLAGVCQQRLDSAKKKVEILSKNKKGQPKLEPFESFDGE